MESNDSHISQDAGLADPSTISLDLEDGSAKKPLTQKLSIVTDNYSMDSGDYGSPLISADPEGASPLDFDGAKRNQMSYSSYLSGRAQEVAKRRNLIERLEKVRDSELLFCTIPQLPELTITQLSMVLRRILKSSSGLREFVSDDVLQHIFEDANSQTPLTVDGDRIPHFPDLSNEPDCVTDHETDVSDEETNVKKRRDMPVSNSRQPDFYSVRRHLISADRYAATLLWRLVEKQNKVKNLNAYEEFLHKDPPKTGNLEKDSQTCVRCRPLIKRPKRNLFSVKAKPQLFRSSSPPRPMIVNDRTDTDFDFEKKDMPAINVTDKVNSEHVMSAYLHRLGTFPLHYAAKSHTAFPGIGRQKDFYGFPSEIQSELSNFPLPLKPVHSNVNTVAQKRRHSEASKDEESESTEMHANNYPLLHKVKNEVKQQFLLKHPPKLLKSKSVFPITTSNNAEERIAPLKIKRSSIQLSAGVNEDLERFVNPFYKPRPQFIEKTPEPFILSAPPLLQQSNPAIPPKASQSTQGSQESSQQQSSPKSSSSSSSSSDDSSSSGSDSEEDESPPKRRESPGSVEYVEPPPSMEFENESDNESSTSTNVSDVDVQDIVGEQ